MELICSACRDQGRMHGHGVKDVTVAKDGTGPQAHAGVQLVIYTFIRPCGIRPHGCNQHPRLLGDESCLTRSMHLP